MEKNKEIELLEFDPNMVDLIDLYITLEEVQLRNLLRWKIKMLSNRLTDDPVRKKKHIIAIQVALKRKTLSDKS